MRRAALSFWARSRAWMMIFGLGLGLGAASMSAVAGDPMRPSFLAPKKVPKPEAVVGTPTVWQLSQVLMRKGQGYAVINDQLVKVGERIDECRLTRVTQVSATLVCADKKRVLDLLE